MRDTDNICEFCGKSFINQRNLQVHVRTAKYCLELRGEKVPMKYACEHCNVGFTLKSPLAAHMKLCKTAKDAKIESSVNSYERKITELETKLTSQKEWYEIRYKGDTETISRIRTKWGQAKDNNKIITAELKQVKISEQKLLKELEDKNAKIGEQNAKIKVLEADVIMGKGILIGINSAKPQVVNNNSGPITNTTNTTVKQKLSAISISKIEPFTIKLINQNIDKYDYQSFLRGESGIVNFLKGITNLELENGTVEKNYVSTNRSRNNFHNLRLWKYIIETEGFNNFQRLIEDTKDIKNSKAKKTKEWKQDAGAIYLQDVLSALAEPAAKHMKTLEKEISEAPDRSPKQDILMKREEKLRKFERGLVDKDTKEREVLFTKIRNRVKDMNSC
jgi:hypothetical protein